MSAQEVDHSTPARVTFAIAVRALDDGFVAHRSAWPITSVMTKRGGLNGTLYVITMSGAVVHLTDADRAAADWEVYDPSGGPWNS